MSHRTFGLAQRSVMSEAHLTWSEPSGHPSLARLTHAVCSGVAEVEPATGELPPIPGELPPTPGMGGLGFGGGAAPQAEVLAQRYTRQAARILVGTGEGLPLAKYGFNASQSARDGAPAAVAVNASPRS